MTVKIADFDIKIKAGPADGLAEGQFSAYTSVFGNRDSYGDVVVEGAFKETLDEWAASGDAIPLLFGHNMSDPDFNIGHVVDATEDAVKIDLNHPYAGKTLEYWVELVGLE